jgi:hypothetical protein
MQGLFEPTTKTAGPIASDNCDNLPNTPPLSAAKRALIAQLRNGQTRPSQPIKIPRSPRGGTAPLSSNQQQSWFFSQIQPQSALYNVPIAIRLRGQLDLQALQKALEQTVARHEILRTRFSGDFDPTQTVDEFAPMHITVSDLRNADHSSREAELQRRVQEEIRRPFDLARDLMIRVRAFQMDEDDWGLTFVLHHIASDFWSWRVLCRELSALYQRTLSGGQNRVEHLPIQYRDFAQWQQDWLEQADCQSHLNFWKTNLAGAPKVLDLPFARPRPTVQIFNGACEVNVLPTDLRRQLSALGRSEEATLFMTLLAAFVALLGQYTDREDIVIGSPAASRCRAELEELIGFFANIMVIRASLKGDPTFREVLRRTREVMLDALAHQEVPFAKLVQELRPARSASHIPFFQIVFMLQQEMAASFRLPGIVARDIDIDTGTAKFDLMLTVLEGEQDLRCCAEYNTDLFDKADIRRVLSDYQGFLQKAVAQPDARLSHLKAETIYPYEQNQNQIRC